MSYQIAPFVEEVYAYDLSEEMIKIVEETANKKGLRNIKTKKGVAETISFLDEDFDCIVSRYSAHHWQNLTEALQEIRRVLKPKGSFILIDILGSENSLLDSFLQTIEQIRDPSHVKNYSISMWSQYAERLGFKIQKIEIQDLSLDFKTWIKRMQTEDLSTQVIQRLQQQACDNIKNNGNFITQVGYFEFIKI